MSEKYPIIAHGELYAEYVTKPLGGGKRVMPRDYSEAKERILDDLDSLQSILQEEDEVFLSEKILCIRLEPKFEAKSYVPEALVSAMSEGNARIVGGRKYEVMDEEGNIETAKLYFLRTATSGIEQLSDVLYSGQKDHVESWRNQLQTINTIDLLRPEEKVMGFEDNWIKGKVEFVLHPMSSETNEEIERFFEVSGIDKSVSKVKVYDSGIVFISAGCSIANITEAMTYNPLRATHPLGNVTITPIREFNSPEAPRVKKQLGHLNIKVGVFDGGVETSVPLLSDYVTAIDGTSESSQSDYVAHGSGVCSAILYGNLAGKTSENELDSPRVKVICHRVLPLRDNTDFDLYEAIDYIEQVVPQHPDVRLYNLSFGPQGAILDDTISRFTYALDRLTHDVPENVTNPLFIVAVGNDGQLASGLNRVQSPSDMVNGLGVGAYSFADDGNKKPTDYSCIGPGREGAKTKPDLLEFGGSLDHPFIVPNTDGRGLSATAGTSFSAPVVTGKIGRIMDSSNAITPHMARTLLIHGAKSDVHFGRISQGFGFCPANEMEVLECNDRTPTIMYSGTIVPKQFLSLPIFLPRINEMKGNVTISWTVSIIVDPYSNDPDAYTNNCLEDVFSPHKMIYNFTKRGAKSVKLNLLKPEDVINAKRLFNEGYNQSSMPVSHPANKALDEAHLRNSDYKWDTIIHKGVTMRSSSLFNPTLTLHAIGRNGFEQRTIKYNVVVTIDAPRYSGSLYDAILQTHQYLVPIDIRLRDRITVR